MSTYEWIALGFIALNVGWQSYHIRTLEKQLQRQTVLRLLRASSVELPGLELVRRSDGVLSRGNVYFVLSDLESDGLIGSDLDGEYPPRRVYGLTKEGAVR